MRPFHAIFLAAGLTVGCSTTSKSDSDIARAQHDLETCQSVRDTNSATATRCMLDVHALESQVEALQGDATRLNSELIAANTTNAVCADDFQECRVAVAACQTQASACQAELQTCATAPTDILELLNRSPGISAHELSTELSDVRVFSVNIRQPIDHDDPSRGSFNQRFVLHHRSPDKPTVLFTTGYSLFGEPKIWANYEGEVAVLTDANQIILEHRYFDGSIPPAEPGQTLDWSYLTIYQSASDSHSLVQRLSAVYAGPWIATGHSKGGMTAIFHQYFYPDDLVGIVPYVAPISFGLADARYLDTLNNIGPADGRCRERAEDMALEMIQRRMELAVSLSSSDSFRNDAASFARFRNEIVGAGIATYARGFTWSAWQRFGTFLCNSQPLRGAPEADLAWWSTLTPGALLTNENPNIAYQYQVKAELGRPAYDTSYLDGALAGIDFSGLPDAPVAPWGADPQFDATAMPKIDAFLRQDAKNVLGIYGAWDPWSGGIITVNEALGSRVFIAQQQTHAARIGNLADAERQIAIAMLTSWVQPAALSRSVHQVPRASWERAAKSQEWLVERLLATENALMNHMMRQDFHENRGAGAAP